MAMRLRSIEQKIFLLILPICLIPPVILLALPGLWLRPAFEQSVGTELSSRAEYLAGMFDSFLGSRLEGLRALAQAPPADPARLATEAGKLGAAGVVVVRPGQGGPPAIVLNDPADKYGRWLAQSRFFKPEIQQGLTLPPAGLIQDLSLSIPARFMPLPFLLFALERPGPERLYFLFEAEELVNAFRHSLPQHPESFSVYSSSGYVAYALGSADPVLVARLGEEMNVARKDSRWFALTSGREQYLIAPAASQLMMAARKRNAQGAIWTILLTEDMDGFLGPLDGFTWLSVVIALGLALVILPVGILVGRRIVRPLIDLKGQAEKLARGDLEVRAAVSSRDEIGDLAETFNTMAQHMRTTYRALEERLAENQLRVSHINALNAIAAAIAQARSLEGIFEILVREAGKLGAFDALWIALLEEGASALAVTQIHPAGLLSLFERGCIPQAGSLHGHAVEHRETLHAEIGPRDRGDFFETRIFRGQGFQSYLIAPLPARGRIIGTLTLAATAPDAFGPLLTPVLTSLAGVVAIAIEQAGLLQRLSRLAAGLRAGGGGEISLTHLQTIDAELDRIAGQVRRMTGLQPPKD